MAAKASRDQLRSIAAFLDPLSLYGASQVSKRWARDIDGNDWLWRTLLTTMHRIVEEKVL